MSAATVGPATTAPAGRHPVDPLLSAGRLAIYATQHVKGGLVSRVVPVPRRPAMLIIDQVDQMHRDQFVAEFGVLSQGPPWIAERAYDARPLADMFALRTAFHDALLAAPPAQQAGEPVGS